MRNSLAYNYLTNSLDFGDSELYPLILLYFSSSTNNLIQFIILVLLAYTSLNELWGIHLLTTWVANDLRNVNKKSK